MLMFPTYRGMAVLKASLVTHHATFGVPRVAGVAELTKEIIIIISLF